MKHKWQFILVNFYLIQLLLSFHITQAEQIEWIKTFGGIKNEHIDHVLVCPNNDIIVIGTFSDSLIFKSDSKNFLLYLFQIAHRLFPRKRNSKK